MIAAKKQPLAAPQGAVRHSIPLGGAVCAAEGGEGAYTFGFDRAEGTLRRGVGAEPLFSEQLPEQPLALYVAGGRTAMVGQSGALYVLAEQGFSDSGIRFTAAPRAVPVEDGSELLLSANGLCVLFGEQTEKLAQEGDCALHTYERLWIASGARLRYSAPVSGEFNAERGGGGYFDVPDGAGDIEALCAYRDEVCVLRERGVELLSAHGDEREFCLRAVCGCPRVYGGTAASAEEGVFFLTERGIFLFGGSTARPFAEDFAPFFAGVEQPDARGCVAGGRYFLQAQARIDGRILPVLAVSRTDGSGGYLLRRAVTGLTACGGAAYCVSGGKPCRLTEGGPFAGTYDGAMWSRTIEPPAERGVMRSLCVQADGVFRLSVQSERGTRYLRAAGGVQTLPVSLPGNRFTVRAESEGAGTLYALSARFVKGGTA